MRRLRKKPRQYGYCSGIFPAMTNPTGNIKHGGHGTLTYARWRSMMQRCYAKSATNYKYYGALGIAVCPQWHQFAAFRTDMGECPNQAMTLDRKDNSRGYEPGNCRWATKAEQNRNRPSHAVLLTHNGATRSVTAWAHAIGITPNTLRQRLDANWPLDRALNAELYGGATPNRHPRLEQLTHGGLTKTVLQWAADCGITPNALRMRIRLGWPLDRALRPKERNRT